MYYENGSQCRERGVGVKQDYAQAVNWYRKAADQDHAFAQYNLAVLYIKGNGVKKDTAEAVKWFRKASINGDKSRRPDIEDAGGIRRRGRNENREGTRLVERINKSASPSFARQNSPHHFTDAGVDKKLESSSEISL